MGVQAPALEISLVPSDRLSDDWRDQVYGLCERAYQEDLRPLFAVYQPAVHLLGWYKDRLVSHAMWVTRWLQSGEGPLLRTAYVENVATEPVFQKRGFASTLMQRLAREIQDYELGALCTGLHDFYASLGWESWQGPLFIRSSQGLIPTPEEGVMILRLPNTPLLDLKAPLSAEWRQGELW